MDPLSASASIITVLGVVGSAGKGLRKLRDLHNAPKDISQLIEEVESSRKLLHLAQNLPHCNLDLHIARLQSAFSELENVVKERLRGNPGQSNQVVTATATAKYSRDSLRKRQAGGDSPPDRQSNLDTPKPGAKAVFNFVRYNTSIRQLQANFAKANASISTALSIHILQESSTARDLLERLIHSQAQIQQDMRHLLNFNKPTLTWVDHASESEKAAGVILADTDTFYDADEGDTNEKAVSLDTRPTPAARKPLMPTASCRPWCQCSCHKRSSWRSPQSIAALLGSIRIAYTGGGYWYPSPCSLTTCSSRQTHTSSLALCSPQWFLSRALLVSTTGFKTVIELPRVRPATDEVFAYSESGDVRALHQCFQQASASPYDVDEHGWSYLHNACYFGHGPMVKYLMDRSADEELQTQVYETPREKALCAIFQGSAAASGWSEDSIDYVSARFDLSSWIQEQNFSRLHKLVLGLISGELTNEEMEHCSAADLEARDAMGRTPLWWAIASGSTPDTTMLVSHGADATIADYGDWSPLCMTVARNKHEHLHCLLKSPKRDSCNWQQAGGGSSFLSILATYGDSETIQTMLSVMPRCPNPQQPDALGLGAGTLGLTPLQVVETRPEINDDARTAFGNMCHSNVALPSRVFRLETFKEACLS